MWGPPTASGLSTPLRETIPESPGDDTFPDMAIPKADTLGPQRASSLRRSRAGTVPSQFPPIGGPASSSAKSSTRPTPSTSPFRTPSSSISTGIGRSNSGASMTAKSALISRIRAGSLPQRSSLLSGSSPFGPSIFSTGWRNQPPDPTSPNSAFQRDFSDTDVKTLDYLGLVDHPQHSSTVDSSNVANYTTNTYPSSSSIIQPLLANFAGVNRSNRFRSYSVNAKEKYAAEEDEGSEYANYYSGTITPSAELHAAALAAMQEDIRQHNAEVQAFANQTSSARPRARTAGVLDKPSSRVWRATFGGGVVPTGLHGNMTTSDYDGLNDAVQALQLQNNVRASMMGDYEGDTVAESTRALWLGGIPTSTTPSSLKAIFEPFGKIESARVLTHKSCGFVNFEFTESAARAKAHFNGKEIFPGAGPVRIGYAKAPSASGTPGGNGHYTSPSPDPFVQRDSSRAPTLPLNNIGTRMRATSGATDRQDPTPPRVQDLRSDILAMVLQFGASEEDQSRIASSVDNALMYNHYEHEIPSVPDPSQSRMYDASRLRDLRKRIDNNSCTSAEIEEIAMSMLPEVAQLASDYLGNTVVQKLFEFCSDGVREAMLQEIAPTISAIGVHKNGTWAAQKIIEVSRTPTQMGLIVDHMRPYAMAAFLDQYGNYVMQCCLKFEAPWNNFIFEVMLTQLWYLAQGRFGARAMRACLESHHATKDQQRMIAAAIALHGVQLATNTNGALVLTWYLDSAIFPNRRTVLAPILVPELARLSVHKVAYLTVLKVINQRQEPAARETILQALFFSANDSVLEEVLLDTSTGVVLIFKILTMPFYDDEDVRSNIVESVRRVLQRMRVQPSQGYKRLMDEVNLPTRGLSSSRDRGQRDNGTSHHTPRAGGYDHDGGYISNSPYGSGTPSKNPPSSGMTYDSFGVNMGGGSPMNHQNQMQYQHAMLAAGRQPVPYNFNPASSNGSPVDPYLPRPGMPSNNSFPRMASDQMAPSQGGFQPQLTFPGGGWQQQQYPGGYMQHQMQGQSMMGGGGARGRVR